ncbi:MAG: aminotransferase class IV [Candidatus Brocadiaceae bacterium]|jgi:branched-subunit amino acid aminotransferase/4-amino-4-deoxychorismate lyase
MAYVYLNGEIVGRQQAAVSPFDRGFLYGDGFFETTRIIAGAPLLLARHLERLACSCRQTGFGVVPDPAELKRAVRAVIEANGVTEGYLRISISRGLHEGRLTELESRRATVLVEGRPMDLPPLGATPPMTLARSRYRRNEDSPVVRHKTLSYQGNLLALAEGRRGGADEVFFLNARDELTEGAITNLFFIHEGTVHTPDVACGLLPGITRQVVLELCRALPVPVEVGRYCLADLMDADEVFCTNSLRGVVPVREVLDCPSLELGAETTSQLRLAYAEFAARSPGEEAPD